MLKLPPLEDILEISLDIILTLINKQVQRLIIAVNEEFFHTIRAILSLSETPSNQETTKNEEEEESENEEELEEP